MAWLPLDEATGSLTDLLPLQQLLGWPLHERPLLDEVLPTEAREALAELVGRSEPSPSAKLTVLDPLGQPRTLLVVLQRGATGALLLAHDVTEYALRARSLSDATAWLRAVSGPCQQVVVVMRADERGRVAPWLILGPVPELLGLQAEELYARSIWKVVHPTDRPHIQDALLGVLAEPGSHVTEEARLRRADGNWRLHELQLSNLTGQPPVDGLLLVLRDVTGRSSFDVLTGLPERALFLDRIARELRRLRAGVASGCAVVVLRLDRFAAVVEALGRPAGDKLLEAIAERLRELLQAADTVARTGPEEFAVLVEGIGDVARVTAWCEVIRASVLEPLTLDEQQIFTTASIGVATYRPEYEQPDELLNAAEAALHRAVRQGGARVEVYDSTLQRELRRRLELEAELRYARQRGELELHYQAIVDLGSGRLAGFEALLRWHRDDGSAVGPSDFVPLAEESDSIHGIGRWVLDRACDQAASWHRAGREHFVSVNVSAVQLGQPGLAAAVAEALGRTGLPPRLLKLEITETALADHPEAAADTLAELRALGVQVVLDDFGTGWASLAYLQRFPFDTLKIDRSFVSGLGHEDGPPLVPVIVALGKAAGMAVVAEGVENAEQLATLRELGCGFAQGFWLSRPVPADAVAALADRDDWLG